MVSEHPAGHLAVSLGQVPQLRRADFHPLFPGGAIDGGDLSGLLALFWTAIAMACADLCIIPFGFDRSHVH